MFGRSVLALVVLVAALSATPGHAQEPPSASSERRAKQLFVEGLVKTQVGEHEAALSFYEKALKHAPDQPAILGAAADAYQATGDSETALLYARRAARQSPDQPRYARQMAGLLADAGRPDAAADAYRRVLEHFPNDRPTLRAFARLHAAQNRPGDALRTYARLLEAGADSAAVLAQMAPIYRRAPDEAASLPPRMRTALDERRSSPGKTPAKTASAEGGSAASLLARARDLAETNPAQARRLLRRALDDGTLDENNQPEAMGLLGTLLFRTSDYGEAARYLTRAVHQNPRDPVRWRSAAEALRRSDQPGEALRTAEDGLLLFPGNLPLLATGTRAALDGGDPVAALEHADEALSLLEASDGDQRAAFLLLRGDALAAQGRAQDAHKAWQKARRLNPQNTNVQERLREQ